MRQHAILPSRQFFTMPTSSLHHRNRIVAGFFCLAALFLFTTPAKAIVVIVNSLHYDISTFTAAFDDNPTALQSQPWWGSTSLATSFSAAVATQLGSPNEAGAYGPLFAFARSSAVAVSAYSGASGSTILATVAPNQAFTYATVASVPETSATFPLCLISMSGLVLVARIRRWRYR